MSKMPLTAAGSHQKKPAIASKSQLRLLRKALLVAEGGVGGLRPPFLANRTPMRSIGYGAG